MTGSYQIQSPQVSTTSVLRRAAAVSAAVGLVLLALPATGNGSAAQHNRPVRFGTTVFRQGGETYADAFSRERGNYGQLGAVRVFFRGLPSSWSTIRHGVGDTRAIVSFKARPAAVVAGKYDARLRQWFAHAPRDRVTRWSYWHEPEDDIAAGHFSAQGYRKAWQHLRALANKAHNPKLRSTLVLMCWTTEPNSGRNWRDYYAGDRTIDQMAFDCYNSGYSTGRYRAPRALLSSPLGVAHQVDKPWGITELGSQLAVGDDGSGRAAWLRQVGRYLTRHGARFCTYFDSDVGVDFRLHDAASRRAWSSVVHTQWSR